MSKKQFSIRLDMDLYEQLDDYRWISRTTLNKVISDALERYLEDEKKRGKELMQNRTKKGDDLKCYPH